jgi:hypothetical protein
MARGEKTGMVNRLQTRAGTISADIAPDVVVVFRLRPKGTSSAIVVKGRFKTGYAWAWTVNWQHCCTERTGNPRWHKRVTGNERLPAG